MPQNWYGLMVMLHLLLCVRQLIFGGANGICTHPAAFTEPNADYYTMAPGKKRSMPVMLRHLLPDKQVCCFYTNGP